jgi:two-component system, NarL family, sensor histidine kinase DegS
MEQISEDINKLQQIKVELIVNGEEPKLSEDVKLGFFRIAQEAINNARKHAKANKVIIDLKFSDGQIQMSVMDNGSGFDIRGAQAQTGLTGSLGLMSMQERAKLIGADLKVESTIGQGTSVSVKVFLQH